MLDDGKLGVVCGMDWRELRVLDLRIVFFWSFRREYDNW